MNTNIVIFFEWKTTIENNLKQKEERVRFGFVDVRDLPEFNKVNILTINRMIKKSATNDQINHLLNLTKIEPLQFVKAIQTELSHVLTIHMN
jgi:hypothetical protein